jgi:peptidoglycan/xylan/chitin deacetylase (PgdA/CDA1 family)
MKALLKDMLLPALTTPPLSNLGTWLFGRGIPIFMLHRMQAEGQPFMGTSPDHLRRCLQYLADEDYHFVSLEEIMQALIHQQPLPPKSVAFTVDDGFWDQAEIAAPIFIEFNCPATIFVITGMLDKRLWPWDAKVSHLINTTKNTSIEIELADELFHLPLSNNQEKQDARNIIRTTIKAMAADSVDHSLNLLAKATDCAIPQSPPTHLKPMDWETARHLENQGIKFAPHTMSHLILSKLDARSAEKEIMGSWQRIQQELTSPSPIFAYPTGRFCDYGPREIGLLKQAGIIGAVSTLPGTIGGENTTPNYEYNLPRLSMPSEFSDFIKCCSWLEQATNKLYSL